MSDEQMFGSHDCSGDAAAYVLGSLTAAEADAFRRHMEGCVICRDEVQALQQVADALPMAARQYAAPRALRRRVLRQVHREARAGAREAAEPGSEKRPGRLPRGWIVVPRSALAVGAAAVLAVAVIGGIELASGGSSGTRVFPASVGQAVLRISNGHGVLVVRKLPQPRAGHIYEVWLQRPNLPAMPNGLFDVAANGGAMVHVPGDLTGVSEVLVTQEPVSGTLHPTSPAVIVTPVT